MKKIRTGISVWMSIVLLVACASSSDRDQSGNRFDIDGDGYLTPEEYSASEISKILKFEEVDTDGDGLLSESELSLRIPGGTRKRSGQREGERRGRGGKSRT
jgi:hypothetical protein